MAALAEHNKSAFTGLPSLSCDCCNCVRHAVAYNCQRCCCTVDLSDMCLPEHNRLQGGCCLLPSRMVCPLQERRTGQHHTCIRRQSMHTTKQLQGTCTMHYQPCCDCVIACRRLLPASHTACASATCKNGHCTQYHLCSSCSSTWLATRDPANTAEPRQPRWSSACSKTHLCSSNSRHSLQISRAQSSSCSWPRSHQVTPNRMHDAAPATGTKYQVTVHAHATCSVTCPGCRSRST
jgi:hypothetical protein